MTSHPCIRVTVWNEFRHEKKNGEVRVHYPDGIHQVIADGLKGSLNSMVSVRLAALDDPDHGLSDEVLDETDVLIWWGHTAHLEVKDEIVEKVHRCVLKGMGLIVLHSGHYSKIFKKLMGTGCGLKWRVPGEAERIWCINPGHPIADGIAHSFDLRDEVYGEFFDIPTPDELVFVSWFEGGEVFRSGCCWMRGKGRIFYFSPGHETYPIYHDQMIQKVISNGVKWAAPHLGT
jgi:trehalose utilization protein